MAVHTKLNKREISDFIQQNYSIGELIDFKEIIDGIDNSNFIILTTKGKFIFTIFENRINKDELPFFMDLKLHLALHKICCPKPIVNKFGVLISSVKNKSAAIVSFLNGTTLKPKEITVNHCAQIGRVLATLHNAVLDFGEVRKNDLGILGWRNLFNKIAGQIDNYQNGLKSEIDNYLNFLEKNWQNNCPSGAAHLDLFPDNVFFDEKNNLSGVIDFYFAANDLFVYDLAISVNAWCFDENNIFDEKKFLAILNEYQKIKKLSQSELSFLEIALLGAGMRFLLTRLHDLFCTPKDSLVKVKDPQEYLEKIRFFFKNSGKILDLRN